MQAGVHPLQRADRERTAFEQRVEARDQGFTDFRPLYDRSTGDILGYRKDVLGYHEIRDRTGRPIGSSEEPIEASAVQGMDIVLAVVPFAGTVTGALLSVAARAIAAGVGRLAAREAASLVTDLAIAAAREEAVAMAGAVPTATLPPIRSAAGAAVRAFESGLADAGAGRLGMSSYNTSGTVAKALKMTGANMEGAHMIPQAVGKFLRPYGYSPGKALTPLLPKVAHTAWDRAWLPVWNQAVKNGTRMTAGDVYTMLVKPLTGKGLVSATGEAVLSEGARGTISWRIFVEMFGELQLQWDTVILAGTP
jgi:hypothetical protein